MLIFQFVSQRFPRICLLFFFFCLLSFFFFFSFLQTWLFSVPVMSDCLWPHRLQHARPTCHSPSPGVFPSSCSLHWWCHPAISSFDTLFSFCPQSFLVSGTFPMSHLFASDDWMQKYWNFSFSISPSSEYAGLISFKSDWFELLAIQGIFRRLLQYHSSKGSILWHSVFFMVQLSQP